MKNKLFHPVLMRNDLKNAPTDKKNVTKNKVLKQKGVQMKKCTNVLSMHFFLFNDDDNQ